MRGFQVAYQALSAFMSNAAFQHWDIGKFYYVLRNGLKGNSNNCIKPNSIGRRKAANPIAMVVWAFSGSAI